MDLERHSLNLGLRPALVLVDMINGFTDPECPLGHDCPSVIDANRELLGLFRARRLPVFYTTVIYDHPDQARIFRARLPALNVLTPDSRWVRVDDRLAPRKDEETIVKHWASGFFKTPLQDRLAARNVDSLVVTGLTTSGCVRATVLDGLQNEYKVVVVRDAVGDRNSKTHEANLFDMNAKYADVLTLGEVRALL